MNLLIAINRLCYGSCLLSVIVGAFLAIYAIWAEQQQVAVKGGATTVVILFASILIVVINGVLGQKVMEDTVPNFIPPRPMPVDKDKPNLTTMKETP